MNRQSYKTHRAFTLVELLMVVIIITMLAALSLTASNFAVKASKEAKTRVTIQKLDTAMRRIYEEYADKFESILAQSNYNDGANLTPEQKAKLKLHLIHDLMRLELPDRSADITTDPQHYETFALNARPPITDYYNATADNPELLFQIIQNLSPETISEFKGSEIGDTNGNGLYEFLDAWGHPIRFIRHAPALPQSDLQPNVWKIADKTPVRSHWDALTNEDFDKIRAQYPYPLDPDKLAEKSWFLYPVIYSAGPDRHYDLSVNEDAPNGDQSVVPFNVPNGLPVGNGYFDNISNHRLSGY
ncbi:hypothetical protein FACS1894170_03820 [Planctomycetales bacterium]|nr:hypothetical protein FACS1894170_03820 [Planctomycetales bacterium]